MIDNKRDYMNLLFLADEQEDMIERYLDKGTMYVLEDDGIKGDCIWVFGSKTDLDERLKIAVELYNLLEFYGLSVLHL